MYDLALRGYSMGCVPGAVIHIRRPLTMRGIQEDVARHYRISHLHMTSSRRDRSVARPRQIAMYLCFKLTPKSYPDIGRAFDRDHTTVMYAVKRIEALRLADGDLAADLDVLLERLVA
jgi:chromosomal replication initiator protein